MISFFPLLVIASVWSLSIEDVRQRRKAQAIIVSIYALLGTAYQ